MIHATGMPWILILSEFYISLSKRFQHLKPLHKLRPVIYTSWIYLSRGWYLYSIMQLTYDSQRKHFIVPGFTVRRVTASLELLIKGKTSNWVYPATGVPFISNTTSPGRIFPLLYRNFSCLTSPIQINSPFSAPPTIWRLKFPFLGPRWITHSRTLYDQCFPLRGKEFLKLGRLDIPGQSINLICRVKHLKLSCHHRTSEL